MSYSTASKRGGDGMLAVLTGMEQVPVVGVSQTEPRVPVLEWHENVVFTAHTGGNQSQ